MGSLGQTEEILQEMAAVVRETDAPSVINAASVVTEPKHSKDK
jgi:hypothetical protein